MAIILTDIGNSKIKIALKQTQENSFALTKSFLRLSNFYNYINNLTSKYEITDFVYCSVRGKLTNQIIEKLKLIFHQKSNIKKINIIKIEYNQNMFSFSYNPMDSYGEDRLAILFYIALNFDKKPVFAIDSGTAITIDTMINLKYEGGFIYPGIGLALKSLFKKTRQLPLIKESGYLNPQNIQNYKVDKFGFSTSDSIIFGVYKAYRGFIKESFNSFCYKLENKGKDKKPIILLTGGDASLLHALIKDDFTPYEIVLDENAVLKGLNYFYKSITEIY